MKPSWKKPFTIVVSALGVLVLLALFFRWKAEHPSLAPLSLAAAVLSMVLFLIVGLRTVPAWAEFWCAEPAIKQPKGCQPAPLAAWKPFCMLLVWNAAMLLLGWSLRGMLLGSMSFTESLNAWVCGDGVHYIDIARDWYLSSGIKDRIVQLVFLPGYPILIRLMHCVIPNWTYAALAVSALCFAGAGTIFYRLMQMDLGEEAARRAVLILCLLPGAFFFTAPMSESLFLLCCVGCLYLIRKGRWLPGCLVGAYAAFTRSLGVTLLVPLVMELVHAAVRRELPKKKVLPAALSLLLIPMGFAAYLYINYRVSGDAFRFLTYQSQHWHQNFGLFFNTAAYQMDYAVGAAEEESELLWGLWLPNIAASFTALIVMIFGAKRLRASYSVWFLPYYFIAIGATWLLSAPRYLLAFFPLTAALAILTEKKAVRAVILVLLVTGFTLYFLAFLLRWQVF